MNRRILSMIKFGTSILPGRRRSHLPDQGHSPHVLIIGGGFGGLNTAKGLRDAPVRITLLDRHNYHLFQPLLYQVATASLSPADIASPLRAIFRRQQNVSVQLAHVAEVDLDRQSVLLDDGELSYDFLVLATGAETAYFGHPEWAELAPGLKNIDDAIEMRRRIFLAFEKAERAVDERIRRSALTFVVVGGGPTGVELAGALGEIAHETLSRDFRSIDPGTARIVLIDGGDRILTAFPENLSSSAARDLNRLGVEIVTNSFIKHIQQGAVEFGSERIEADTILWAAGVTATPVGKSLDAPVDRGGRIAVSPDLRLPDHPEVFVIGDLAAIPDGKGGTLPGVAQVAIQGGKWTATNITRMIAGEPLLPFRYRDLGIMATIGRNRAVAVIGGLRFGGFPAWFIWAVIHVHELVEYRSRVIVFVQWSWAYLTHRRSARLITGESRAPKDLTT